MMIRILSDPGSVDAAAVMALGEIEKDILQLADRLNEGSAGMQPTDEALAQPKWGTSELEISLLPMTPRGVLFDSISQDVVPVAEKFLKIRNLSPEVQAIIASTAATLKELKAAEPDLQLDEVLTKDRKAYIKAVERIFKRIDDANIFPSEVMQGVMQPLASCLSLLIMQKAALALPKRCSSPVAGS